MNRGTVSRQETATLGEGVTHDLAQAVTAAADRVHEAWVASDTSKRAALLAEVCADDVVYANPVTSSVGVGALAALITELAAAYPGHTPGRTSGVDAHHDAARYTWALSDRAGQSVLAGIEIVRFTPEGRLTFILSFFGQPPQIRYTYQA
ncbi:MAG: nuclear transport factor 2 family protein [Frankia sp.]